MIKHLILISLVIATIQIPNCEVTKLVCKTCISGDYQLVQLNPDETKCMRKTEYDALIANISHCAESQEPGTCKICQRNFLVDNDKNECLNKTHCSELNHEEICKTCFYPFLLNEVNGTCIEKDLCLKLKDGDKCEHCRPHYYPESNGECQKIQIPHCMIYDGNNCTKCDPNFYVDEYNNCTEYSEGCLKMDDIKKECTQCIDYYHPNGTICEKNPDINCITMDGDDCKNCSGYNYPNKSHCMPYPENCIELNHNNSCTKCNDSYYLDDKKKCLPKPQNCNTVNETSGKCLECVSLYYLDKNDTCREKPENCDTVNKKTDKCEKCNDYYHLDGEKCVNNTEKCIDYDIIAKECTRCDPGYYPDGKICKQIPAHCSFFNIPEKLCKKCEESYYEDEWTNCQPYPYKCENVDSNYKCQKCEEYYYLDEDKNCKEKPANCYNVNATTGICEICDQSYYLDANKTCQHNPNKCSFVNETTYKCEKCEDYYHLENNSCVPNKDNCITQDPVQGNCTKCNETYFINGEKNCEPNPEHCLKVNETTFNCTVCSNYFYPAGKGCKEYPQHCISINDETKECRECNSSHYLKNGTCNEKPSHCLYVDNSTLNVSCELCYPYYHLDENKDCQQNKERCIRMDNDGTNCTECDDYYHPQDDECIQNNDQNCITMDKTITNCTNCTYGYYPNDSHCSPYPDNCILMNFDTKKCEKCNVSYELDDDKICFPIPENCKTVNTTNRKCIKCKDSFYLDQGEACRPNPINCRTVDETTYNCSECNPYYHLDNNSNCIENPKYCSQMDKEAKECLKCDEYFYPDGKQCKKNQDNCKIIGSTPQICSQCDNKYYENHFIKCEILPEHCKEINKTSKICRECEDDYHLEGENCIPNPEHCNYFNETSNECVNCTQYYYLNEKKECEKYPDYCKTFNETNKTCIECYEKFYPYNGECKSYPPHCESYNTSNNKCINCTYLYYYLEEDGNCKANPAHCNGVDPSTGRCNSCEKPYDFNDSECINPCAEYEDVCQSCSENYGSFDYGKTCKPFVPDEEQKKFDMEIIKGEEINEVKIGDKGILYFFTDYSDKIKEIFNPSDIEEKTKFETKIVDENNKEHKVNCRLYNTIESKIGIICKLENILEIGNHKIKLIGRDINYKDYQFSIKSNIYIDVKQFNCHIPFLFSIPQNININKNKETYELKFKSESYENNDILYIRRDSKNENYLLLDNCKNENNEVKCQITKEKIESIISSEQDNFVLGTMNDNVGAFKFYFAYFIQINYKIEKKEEIIVTIKKLLYNEASIDSTFAYETDIQSIPSLTTTNFGMNFATNEIAQCHFKKTKKIDKLLLICGFNNAIKGSETFLGEINEHKYFNNIHPKYYFDINPISNYEKITIKGESKPIRFVYPENIDLTLEKPQIVRFLTESSSNPEYIKLNSKSYTYLECVDLPNMKKCEVPLSHFEDQTTGEFYPLQYLDKEKIYPAFYDSNSINITLPNLVTLKIEKKDNLDKVKIGQKGVIYLITDYNDDSDKFPQSSIANINFIANFGIINGNDNYTSECKLWRLETSKNIRILCQLNENLKSEYQDIYLKQTSFINNNLGVIVSYRAKEINVKQLDFETSFLYSDKKDITIKDNEANYKLDFNVLHRDNGTLYLYTSTVKSIILDSCTNENNKLTCNVKKDKLLEILSYSGEVFSVGEKYDNDGIYKFDSVLNITIKSEIKKKNIKIKIGKLLTKEVSKNAYIVYDTETDENDIKEITSDFIYMASQEINELVKCLFKKNNQNKLLFLCDASKVGKGSLGQISPYTYNDINALYNIQLEQSTSTDEFNVLDTQGTKIYSVYPLELDFNKNDEYTIQYEAQYPDNLRGVKLSNDSEYESKTPLTCGTKDGYRLCKVKQDYFSSSGEYYTYHSFDENTYGLSYELPMINVVFKKEEEKNTDGSDGDGNGNKDGDDDTDIGLIIGLSVAGGVIVLAVVIFLIWHYCRKKDSDGLESDDSKGKLLTTS